jgi:hypothetical protein
MNPTFCLIFPLGELGAGMPGQGLPGVPVYPGQGLPAHPGHPSHPIIIPPGALGPGNVGSSHPIVLPDPPAPDQGLPGGGWGGYPSQGLPGGGYPSQGLPGGGYPSTGPILPGGVRPSHPIVYPPGLPDQGLPPTPGLPPLVPTNPIAGLPEAGQLPSMPPVHPWLPGHGPGDHLSLPEGSVMLIPVPQDKPMPVPPTVPTGSMPYIAWAGRGKAPVLVWIAPKATPK